MSPPTQSRTSSSRTSCPPKFFEALLADFPTADIFAGQQAAHGAGGSRTGTGFDLYRGDDAYEALTGRSEAWRQFDAYINSEQFADTFREIFADHIDDIGLRIDIANSHVDPGYVEPREVLAEMATPVDRIAGLGLKVLDRFQPIKPVSLFTRLDIHRSLGGYKPSFRTLRPRQPLGLADRLLHGR